MDEYYYKHYITVDDQGRITDAWSDGPKPDRDTTGAVCINEQGGYQFRFAAAGEENPVLYTQDGIPLYKWDGEAVALRSQEELETDRAAIPTSDPSANLSGEVTVIDNLLTRNVLPETDSAYSLGATDVWYEAGYIKTLNAGDVNLVSTDADGATVTQSLLAKIAELEARLAALEG